MPAYDAVQRGLRLQSSSIEFGELKNLISLLALTALGMALLAISNGPATIALLLCSCGVAIYAPTAAVAAIPIAVPFVQHHITTGSSVWSPLELTIAIATAAVGVRLLFAASAGRSVAEIVSLARPYGVTISTLLLLAVGAVSLLTVADTRYRPESLRDFRWVIVEPLAAFILFRWIFKQSNGRTLLITALLGTGAIVAADGMLQLITQSGVVIADGVERATGPYSHPNNLALYLDRVSIFVLALALTFKSHRRLLIAVAIICGLGLAATLSRGAAIAYIAGAVWIVGAARIKHGWRWIAAGAAIAFVVVAYVGGQRLTDSGSTSTASSRELIWTSSIHMIKDHPITGVGLDQFFNQYGRRYVQPAGWPERYTSHPHNIILDVWLSLGVLGLISFAFIGLQVLRRARLRASGARNRAIWIGSIGALIAGLTHGMLDNGYFLPDLAVLTWLFIALLESSVGSLQPLGAEADG
jgi:putative inorganic carbon (HCO3(-)) transporter